MNIYSILIHGFTFLVLEFISFNLGSQCFGPPVNHIFSTSPQDFYCPWYRNLIRHIPMEDGICPSSSIYRNYKNCLSDNDCPKDSYCCFSICNGITRCYNPYNNEWAERLPGTNYKGPCPLIQIPNSTEAPTPAANATEKPVTTTTTTATPRTTTTLRTTTTTTNVPSNETTKPIKVPLVDEQETTTVATPTTRPPSSITKAPEPTTPAPHSPPPKVTEKPKDKKMETITHSTMAKATTEEPKRTTEGPEAPTTPGDDVYDQIIKTQTTDDDAKFVAEEGV